MRQQLWVAMLSCATAVLTTPSGAVAGTAARAPAQPSSGVDVERAPAATVVPRGASSVVVGLRPGSDGTSHRRPRAERSGSEAP
jgi:hypothetical protein